MKRAGSQLMCPAPNKRLRQMVLELTNDNYVSQLIDLTQMQSESASTLFFDGVISAGIFSLKLHAKDADLVADDYFYLNLKNPKEFPLVFDKTKFIIDGETEDPSLFSDLLKASFSILQHLSLLDIISATSYLPAQICKINNQIFPGNYIEPILWTDCNLSDLKITDQTTLKKLF